MMASAGFDWLTIDLEHTSTTVAQAAEMVRVVTLAGLPVFARISGHDTDQIKRLLDMGVSGIIAPDVRSEQDATTLAAACRYPPNGTRGVGLARAQGYGRTFEAYRDDSANHIIFVPQIEHIDAVENLDAILAAEGVDGFFVGPYDLSGSLGLPGDFDHPDVKAAIESVADHIRADGPFAGTHVVEPDLGKLAEAVEAGYRFIAFASEMLIFSERLEKIATGLEDVR